MGRKKLQVNRAELILQAAGELFAQYSYEKTTIDEIAMHAGISKGSVYLEYESKEEILFSIIARNKEAQLAELQRLAAKDAGNVLTALKTMLIWNIGDIFDSVQRNRLNTEEIIQSRERLRERLRPFFEARLALIEALLKKGVEKDQIEPQADYRRTAQLLMQTLRSVMPPYEKDASKLKLQNEAAEILELVFNGLRP